MTVLDSSSVSSAFPYFGGISEKKISEENMEGVQRTKPKQVINKKYSCISCDSSFHTLTNLQNHNVAIHQKIKPFKCEECPFTCARQDNLNSHFKHKHKEKSMKCERCNYATNFAKEFERHMGTVHASEATTHTSSSGFKCTKCNYITAKKEAFAKHVSVAHGSESVNIEWRPIKEEHKRGNLSGGALKTMSNKNSSEGTKLASNVNIKQENVSKMSSKNAPSKKMNASDVPSGMRVYICDTCDSKYIVRKEIIEYVKCKSCYTNKSIKTDRINAEDIKRPSKIKMEHAMESNSTIGKVPKIEIDKPMKRVFECDNCPSTFTRRDHKRRHVDTGVCRKNKISPKIESVVTNEDPNDSSIGMEGDDESSDKKAIIQCDHCELSCLGVDIFLVHLKDFHPDLYREEAVQEEEEDVIEPLQHVQADVSMSGEE